MKKELLDKYFNDQCTPEEEEKVWEWFQTAEGEAYLKQEIDRDIRVEDEFGDVIEHPELNSERLFNKIQQSKSTSWFQNIGGWKKAAAAILILGMLGLAASFYMQFHETETKIVKTAAGEKKTMVLPDSSRIVLHSNSSLEYDSGFEDREVFLDGEAYFEVKHHEDQPFMVLVDDTYIKVLGTEFVVSKYNDSERVKVAVKSGIVELGSNLPDQDDSKTETIKSGSSNKSQSSKEHSIKIFDNQVGIKDKGSNLFIGDSSDYDQVFDWVNNKMIFRNTSMAQVITEIENRFGVQIVLKDRELARKKFTAAFDDETLDQILKVITLSFDASYTREGDKIFISY